MEEALVSRIPPEEIGDGTEFMRYEERGEVLLSFSLGEMKALKRFLKELMEMEENGVAIVCRQPPSPGRLPG